LHIIIIILIFPNYLTKYITNGIVARLNNVVIKIDCDAVFVSVLYCSEIIETDDGAGNAEIKINNPGIKLVLPNGSILTTTMVINGIIKSLIKVRI
jgi:hypothetical protein